MHAGYDAIVDRLYAGTGDPREWVDGLPDICRYVGGEVGQLVVAGRDREIAADHHFYALTPNRDIKDVHRIVAEYGARDPRRSAIYSNLGTVLSDREIEPQSFERSGIVADYLDRLDVRRHLVCAVPAAGSTIATLSVMRSRRADFFTAVERKRMEQVTRHLDRALRLNDMLSEREAGLGALSLIAAPLILLSSLGRVVFTNDAARELVASGDLPMVANRLKCRKTADQDSLMQALKIAVAGAGPGQPPEPAIWTLTTARDRHQFLAMPLAEAHMLRTASGPGRIVALVGLASHSTPTSRLRQLYALSAAEARLAVALANGETIKATAQRLEISLNTARDHLKAVFRKMGVERQSALVMAVKVANSLPLKG